MSETTVKKPCDATPDNKGDDRACIWTVTIELVRVMAITIALGFFIAAFLPTRAPIDMAGPALPAGWSPVAWPFLRDQFDPGIAARCTGVECPISFEITIRPKRGFCDCEHGVYDDTQLRQVGDLDLASAAFSPRGVGEPISVAGLQGRLQRYAARSGEVAVAAALHKGCDVIAIVARGRDGRLNGAAVLDFLRLAPVERWLTGLLKDPRPA